MDEICGLTFHLSYVDLPQDFFLEIPLCACHVIVITELVLLINLIENGFRIGEISKIYFSRPLFTIIFRPEMLKLHPYSILTGDTRVEFFIYCVLKPLYIGVLFLIYNFKKHFKPSFFILKAL